MHGIKITELFSYALTAQLACYMQNFIQINLISFGWEQMNFQSNLNYTGKIISETDQVLLKSSNFTNRNCLLLSNCITEWDLGTLNT